MRGFFGIGVNREEGRVKRLDRNLLPTASISEVLKRAQTGDILLVSGAPDLSSALGTAIRAATSSYYSHVGMIISDPTEQMWADYGKLKADGGIYKASGGLVPRDKRVYIFDSDFEEDGSVDGPVLRPLETVLFGYMADDYYGTDCDVCIRHLNVPEERRRQMTDRLATFMHSIAGRSFEAKSMGEKQFLQMVKSMCDANVKEDLSKFFCSELCAASYQRMGLLSMEAGARISSNHTPKDFASPHLRQGVKYHFDMNAVLLGGAWLDPEVRIDLSELQARLLINVRGASGLPNADANHLIAAEAHSDPYCVVSLSGRKKFQTEIHPNTEDPRWEQEFECDYDTCSPITFSVLDHDRFQKDDKLGKATLSVPRFYPDGYNGEIKLEDTIAPDARVRVCIKVVRQPQPIANIFEVEKDGRWCECDPEVSKRIARAFHQGNQKFEYLAGNGQRRLVDLKNMLVNAKENGDVRRLRHSLKGRGGGYVARLDEVGYDQVWALRSPPEMGLFIRRLLQSLGCRVTKEEDLIHLALRYSGNLGQQRFGQLHTEVTEKGLLAR